MKTAWDSYLDEQLADPIVRQAFDEEARVLSISNDGNKRSLGLKTHSSE